MIGERAKRVFEEGTKFVKNRANIALNVASDVEKSVRSTGMVLLELDIPPNPSAEFEETRRKAIKENRRNFLETSFPMLEQWSKIERVDDFRKK